MHRESGQTPKQARERTQAVSVIRWQKSGDGPAPAAADITGSAICSGDMLDACESGVMSAERSAATQQRAQQATEARCPPICRPGKRHPRPAAAIRRCRRRAARRKHSGRPQSGLAHTRLRFGSRYLPSLSELLCRERRDGTFLIGKLYAFCTRAERCSQSQQLVAWVSTLPTSSTLSTHSSSLGHLPARGQSCSMSPAVARYGHLNQALKLLVRNWSCFRPLDISGMI